MSRPVLFAVMLLFVDSARAEDAPGCDVAGANDERCSTYDAWSGGEEPLLYRPTTSGPFVSLTALVPEPGQMTLQPILSTSRARATFDAEGALQPFGPGEEWGTAALSLFLEAGVVPRVSAGAQTTVQYQWHALASDDSASAAGVGDSQVFVRAVLLQETARLLPEVTLLGLTKINTGNAASRRADLRGTDVFGTGSVDATLGVSVTRGLRPFVVHADVLYTHALPARVGGVETQYGGTAAWSAATEWPILPESVALMVEVSGRHQAAATRDGVREPDGGVGEVIAGGGVELLFGPRLQLLLGYQRSVWGRNTAVHDIAIVTLVPTVF